VSETLSRRLPLAILMIAAACFLGLGLSEAHTDSPTYDEPVYVSAGLAAILHQDLEYNAEHPPLPKAIAALPVLLAHPVVPPNGGWNSNDERDYSATFTHAQLAAGRLDRVTFTARLIPLLESVAVAFAIFALVCELFDDRRAAAFAGLLWLASPLVLGIGHLNGTDVPFALAVTLSSWALARWLRLRTMRALLWTGAALALTAGTAISGAFVVLVALAVIVGVTWRKGWREALRNLIIAGVVTWAGLWIPYILLDPGVLTHLTVIAPKPYLDGLSYLRSYDASGFPGYLAGIAYTGSRWWYWPVSLLLKYPASTLLLLVGGLAAWWWAKDRSRVVLAVWLPALVLTVFTVTSPLNIGVRLLLPVMALWSVAAAALVPVLARKAWMIAVLVAISVAGTALSFPGSIAWSAPPFRPAYAELTDSNVDWGQSWHALATWSTGKDPWVTYFGPRGITEADIPGARTLLNTPPAEVTGWVAVSATALTSSDAKQLAWLRNYCPVDVLDGTILIYRFQQPPTAAPGPARPPSPCPGTYSKRA
jgi:4-amino-4-deoxy-L-arabinose transferase-like glycosyltransferase